MTLITRRRTSKNPRSRCCTIPVVVSSYYNYHETRILLLSLLVSFLLSIQQVTAFSSILVSTKSYSQRNQQIGIRTTTNTIVKYPSFVSNLISSSSSNSLSQLYMSSNERQTTKTTKKSVQVLDKTETKAEEQKKKEEMWRVVLHNDEVHTFNYVVRSLTKVIGTLDRKAAFEICVQTHGIGKATITKTWKKQAEQFCLGLQRQGLTVSISPDEDFEGGHSGGGL